MIDNIDNIINNDDHAEVKEKYKQTKIRQREELKNVEKMSFSDNDPYIFNI